MNKAGVGYGEELSISIQVMTIPELSGIRILDAETNRLQCTILNTGGSKITGKGFCWSTHDYPDLSDGLLSTDENFTVTLGELYPGVYYIRAYAINKVGTGYSRTLKLDTRTVPELGDIEMVDAETHRYRSKVLNDGGGSVDCWGFCLNTTGNPGIQDRIVLGDSDFTAVIDELLPGVYYIRAYAINEIGVGYSREFSVIVD